MKKALIIAQTFAITTFIPNHYSIQMQQSSAELFIKCMHTLCLSVTSYFACQSVAVNLFHQRYLFRVQISTLHMFFRLYLPPGSGRLRQPATIDPTLDQAIKYVNVCEWQIYFENGMGACVFV